MKQWLDVKKGIYDIPEYYKLYSGHRTKFDVFELNWSPTMVVKLAFLHYEDEEN